MEQLRAAGNNPESGSRVDNFLKYITGQRTLTQDNTIPAEARERYKVALHPFAISVASPTAADRYETAMSAYSIKGLRDRASVNFADLGLQLIAGGEKSNPLYFPALLRAKYASTTDTAAANRTSDITGETYKYKYGRTFSFPFGRTITATEDAESGAAETNLDNADELDVLKSIKNKISEAGQNRSAPESISYEPEEFRTPPVAKALATTDQPVGTFTVS